MPTELILTNDGPTERDKATEAIKLLQFYEGLAVEQDPRGYMVGYSGGKDSTVLARLFREAGVKHFLLHNITGIDPPELVYFKRRQFDKWSDEGVMCRDSMYRESLIQTVRRHGTPPTRVMRFCCQDLKEYIIPDLRECIKSFGVRKEESAKRAKKREEIEVAKTTKRNRLFVFDSDERRRQFEACCASGFREIRINPITYWTDTDVWDFIHDRKADYCELYCEGFERLGCVGCPMAGDGRKAEFARWPGLERVWRFAFAAAWEAREAAGRKWWQGIKSVDDLWAWWMEDLPKLEQLEGQMELDEI